MCTHGMVALTVGHGVRKNPGSRDFTTTTTSGAMGCSFAATPSYMVVIPDPESTMVVTGQTPFAPPLGTDKSARHHLFLLSATRPLSKNPGTSPASSVLHAGAVSDPKPGTVSADMFCCTPPVGTTGSGGFNRPPLGVPLRSAGNTALVGAGPSPPTRGTCRGPRDCCCCSCCVSQAFVCRPAGCYGAAAWPTSYNPSGSGPYLNIGKQAAELGPDFRDIPEPADPLPVVAGFPSDGCRSDPEVPLPLLCVSCSGCRRCFPAASTIPHASAASRPASYTSPGSSSPRPSCVACSQRSSRHLGKSSWRAVPA